MFNFKPIAFFILSFFMLTGCQQTNDIEVQRLKSTLASLENQTFDGANFSHGRVNNNLARIDITFHGVDESGLVRDYKYDNDEFIKMISETSGALRDKFLSNSVIKNFISNNGVMEINLKSKFGLVWGVITITDQPNVRFDLQLDSKYLSES